MKRTAFALFAIALLILVTAGTVFWLEDKGYPTQAGPPPSNAIVNIPVVNGETIVTVSPSAQAQAGIVTIRAKSVLQKPSIPAYGVVIDPQTIIDARNNYITARSNDAVARASLEASQKQADRLRRLLEQSATSLMDYQAAEAAALSDQAKLNAADLALRNSEGAARSQFGEVIARWILAPTSQDFQRLLARQDSLIRVTLPLGDTLEPSPSITVTTNDNQNVTANLISRAAQSDPDIQGAAYIYRMHIPLATNLHVTAHMAVSATPIPGILVPASAVVWYGGVPWAYKKIAPDKFVRQQLVQPSESDNNYFVSRGFSVNDSIVGTGAQLLLSAEQMPPPSPAGNKDNDDD
jgi:hypothetical protein